MWQDKLRRMKSDAGMTTRQIAEETGIPEPTLEKIFSGATKGPRLDTVARVVRALGGTLDELDDAPITKNAPRPDGQDARMAEIARIYESLNEEGRAQLYLQARQIHRCGDYAPKQT